MFVGTDHTHGHIIGDELVDVENATVKAEIAGRAFHLRLVFELGLLGDAIHITAR